MYFESTADIFSSRVLNTLGLSSFPSDIIGSLERLGSALTEEEKDAFYDLIKSGDALTPLGENVRRALISPDTYSFKKLERDFKRVYGLYREFQFFYDTQPEERKHFWELAALEEKPLLLKTLDSNVKKRIKELRDFLSLHNGMHFTRDVPLYLSQESGESSVSSVGERVDEFAGNENIYGNSRDQRSRELGISESTIRLPGDTDFSFYVRSTLGIEEASKSDNFHFDLVFLENLIDETQNVDKKKFLSFLKYSNGNATHLGEQVALFLTTGSPSPKEVIREFKAVSDLDQKFPISAGQHVGEEQQFEREKNFWELRKLKASKLSQIFNRKKIKKLESYLDPARLTSVRLADSAAPLYSTDSAHLPTDSVVTDSSLQLPGQQHVEMYRKHSENNVLRSPSRI